MYICAELPGICTELAQLPLQLSWPPLLAQFGNNTLRLTTRQTYQLHAVLKQDLKTVFSTVIKNMGTTLGACGDVNRNVLAPPVCPSLLASALEVPLVPFPRISASRRFETSWSKGPASQRLLLATFRCAGPKIRLGSAGTTC